MPTMALAAQTKAVVPVAVHRIQPQPQQTLPHWFGEPNLVAERDFAVAAVASRRGAAVLCAAVISATCSMRRRMQSRRTTRHAGFGPQAYEQKQRKENIETGEIGQRVGHVITEEKNGIIAQLQQYGFCQIDGLLGGSVNGYPDQIREQMKKLFDRGWFQQESQQDATFKVGEYHITNTDTDHRFTSKMFGAQLEDAGQQKVVETQFEVAPSVVNFTRALIASLATPIGKMMGSGISTNVAMAEMHAMCGEGARFDRRVSNVFGWNTERGFVEDKRKLTAFYFANPTYREELGGHLQLEGVITPTGAVSIAPLHDRLVLCWSDRTVWSMRPSYANRISEHQYAVLVHLMVNEASEIKYNPVELARWFPELRDQPMTWPPPNLIRA
mmetsp:Transcript_100751/g.194723  ORF Transcript_100751/g.194723 Transcript_100751/m.194723 type:complete len:385 (+) Transcript_100751:36-1190(+)